jgi:hypothetical protein
MKTFKNWLASISKKIPKPYRELIKLVMNYDSPWMSPEILYLGDSVLERISKEDVDRRTLDQMVADYLVGKKHLLCISHPAYHLKIYYYLLKIFTRTRQKPKQVILPINMRNFSPQWDLNPAWQFDEEINAVKNYLENPRRKFQLFKYSSSTYVLSEAEKRMEVTYPFTSLNRIGQFNELINSKPTTDSEKLYRKTQIFIFHYLHPLTPAHPKILFLIKTLEMLRELKISVLIYITPINYQGGERLVGDGFINLIRANVDVIRHSIALFLDNQDVRFMDLEETLTSDYFFNSDEASEHLNQHGREQLAKTIANEILLDS